MKDKTFLDTNILVYFVSDNFRKKNIANEVLSANEEIVISSQVINEFVAVTIRKHILSFPDAVNYANEFMDIFWFSVITRHTIKLSFDIRQRYGFSTWDSLIIASALENDCSVLFSEDMQDGQVIENKLKIVNPFKI
ncbi:PIN domain-containing protein [Desulfobacterales bacterium HSG17]|nr:PIN domain-containing protein [Desulfobacterales bacterium HSG17]